MTFLATRIAVDDFVKRFCSGDLQFEPGSKFHYNNSGYFILGAILEHVTGKTYEALLKGDIFVPLAMKDSGYDHHADILPRRAAGYQLDLGGVVNAPYLDMSIPYAAGSLYSTVEDLYKWDQALYTDKLLPSGLKQKLFTPNLEHYGYGWFIRAIAAGEPGGGQTMISHGGGINGFNTLEQRLVGDHDLIVIFNNTPGASLDEMAKGIRAILYMQQPALPKRSIVHDLGLTLVDHGSSAAVAQYQELKRSSPNDYTFDERALAQLGSLLLQKGRNSDAIAILKLNVEEYPKSVIAHDSLADAYAKDGQKAQAIANYHQSLELDPKDQNATDRLQRARAKVILSIAFVDDDAPAFALTSKWSCEIRVVCAFIISRANISSAHAARAWARVPGAPKKPCSTMLRRVQSLTGASVRASFETTCFMIHIRCCATSNEIMIGNG